MNSISPEFVERYQILYAKDPKSRIFAPLAEAYRRMGLLKEALQVSQNGVEDHPHFASGLLTHAKILNELNYKKEAIYYLRKAVDLAPENILAQSTLASLLMEAKEAREALQVYKMILYLNPEHAEALKAVKKLESLSAEDFDEDSFTMGQLDFLHTEQKKQINTNAAPIAQNKILSQDQLKQLERMLSLADAFIVRNDIEKAMSTLNAAVIELGEHKELSQRLNMLRANKFVELPEADEEDKSFLRKQKSGIQDKIDLLENLLQRINMRRLDAL